MFHSQFPASFAVDLFRCHFLKTVKLQVQQGWKQSMKVFHPGWPKVNREHNWAEKNGRSYPPMMVEVEWPYKETASLEIHTQSPLNHDCGRKSNSAVCRVVAGCVAEMDLNLYQLKLLKKSWLNCFDVFIITNDVQWCNLLKFNEYYYHFISSYAQQKELLNWQMWSFKNGKNSMTTHHLEPETSSY